MIIMLFDTKFQLKKHNLIFKKPFINKILINQKYTIKKTQNFGLKITFLIFKKYFINKKLINQNYTMKKMK